MPVPVISMPPANRARMQARASMAALHRACKAAQPLLQSPPAGPVSRQWGLPGRGAGHREVRPRPRPARAGQLQPLGAAGALGGHQPAHARLLRGQAARRARRRARARGVRLSAAVRRCGACAWRRCVGGHLRRRLMARLGTPPAIGQREECILSQHPCIQPAGCRRAAWAVERCPLKGRGIFTGRQCASPLLALSG